MAVTVFIFILLLGGVAGESNSIDDLVNTVESNCRSAGTGSSICDNLVNKFREETNNGPNCKDANSDDVARTYLGTLSTSTLTLTSRPDKTLLWSGDGMLDKALNQDSKDNIEKTPAAKSVYSLHWAKKAQSTTISWYSSVKKDDSYCDSDDCPYPLENLYWSLASSRFAAQAQGEVEVYLATNADGRTYREESFFRRYEVPNLIPGRVTKLTIQLFDSKGEPSSNCDIPNLCVGGIWKEGVPCECVIAGTSKLAAGNYSVTGTPYWRPDGTCDSCMKLPSVMTIIIPILTLLLKS